MIDMRKTTLMLIIAIALLIISTFSFASFEDCSGKVEGESCFEYKLIKKQSGAELCEEVPIINCCDNDSCEQDASANYSEDFGNCPADCDPIEVVVTPLTPEDGETFYRGEKVNLKIRLTSSDTPVIGGTVTAESNFFKKMQLFNDGRHDDGSSVDNVYANSFEVPKEAVEGVYDISVFAKFRDINSTTPVNLVVKPFLTTDAELKEKYALGDNIVVEGTLKKKANPVAIDITMKIMAGEKLVNEQTFRSDDEGRFKVEYHTSLLSPKGKWALTLTGKDDYDNSLNYQTEFEVLEPKTYTSLQVSVLNDFNKSYARGNKFDLKVKVSDEAGKAITGATVKLTTPQQDILPVPEITGGEYGGEVQIDYDIPSGRQKYEVYATKTDGSLSYEGKVVFQIVIEEIKMLLQLTKPDKVHYEIGEYVPIEVRLTYPDGEKIGDANVVAKVNGKTIELKAEEVGIYYANFIPDEKDEGRVTLTIEASDVHGNTGGAETKLDISGVSLNYIINKNLVLIIAAVIAFIIVAALAIFFVKKRGQMKGLVKRRKELNALTEELQVKYYDESSISKAEYKGLTDKYAAELDDIERKIEQLRHKEQGSA